MGFDSCKRKRLCRHGPEEKRDLRLHSKLQHCTYLEADTQVVGHEEGIRSVGIAGLVKHL